jgi:hypothetical protein
MRFCDGDCVQSGAGKLDSGGGQGGEGICKEGDRRGSGNREGEGAHGAFVADERRLTHRGTETPEGRMRWLFILQRRNTRRAALAIPRAAAPGAPNQNQKQDKRPTFADAAERGARRSISESLFRILGRRLLPRVGRLLIVGQRCDDVLDWRIRVRSLLPRLGRNCLALRRLSLILLLRL